MKLNIYKNKDMGSEDLLMSFENVKKGDTLEVTGLASNTVYYINLVDDEDKEIEFKGNDSFETMYMSDKGKPDYDESGYRIKLERDGFYLYLGEKKVNEVEGLQYSINDKVEKQKIDSFPISINDLNDKDYIVIWKDENDIAYSEQICKS